MSESARFLGFQSGVFEKSVLLGYETVSQANRFPTFQTNVVPTDVLNYRTVVWYVLPMMTRDMLQPASW